MEIHIWVVHSEWKEEQSAKRRDRNETAECENRRLKYLKRAAAAAGLEGTKGEGLPTVGEGWAVYFRILSKDAIRGIEGGETEFVETVFTNVYLLWFREKESI